MLFYTQCNNFLHFTPYLVNCREHDKIIYKQRIQQVFDALTYGAYFICIIITITSPIIMKIFIWK